jgi:anthranilate/para-aminobenzoate synthase component I
MTKEEYLEHVTQIKESIRNGDLYQANLTRKFYGQFNHNIEGLGLFLKLCKHSPSPYSAFLKHGDLCVLSSSPERFIHIDSKGEAEIRPIKGSAARSNDNYVDNQLKEQLKNSIKDQAENLMIVDLSRNDLSRNCDLGSVKVTKLFDITSYATVHHMSSAIKGRKSPKSSTLQLVQGCFPPGSMTGAPKIKAIELCSKIEKQERGIYSGAIGWFGGDGSTDLSVVIRTLIIEKQKFEFQVGGAIVSDSDPYKEWEETMTKAQGLIKALGLSEKTLQAL